METTRDRLCLSSGWQFRSDPSGEGLLQNWMADPPPPGMANFACDLVWCFHSFEFSLPLGDRQVTLQLLARAEGIQAWLNGVEVLAGAAPRSGCEVSQALKSGTNWLAVRLRARGYMPFLTEAQLTLRPKEHLRRLLLLPDIRRKRLTAQAEGTGAGKFRLQFPGGGSSVEGDTANLALETEDLAPWTPDSPTLHNLMAYFAAPTGTDASAIEFGLREFSVKDDFFHLNHRPFHLRAVQFSPDELLEATSAASLEAAIGLAKATGFNALSVPEWSLTQGLMELCDRQGILVIAELTLDASGDPLEGRLKAQVDAVGNHASVVMWRLRVEVPPAESAEFCKLLNRLDPTRVWLLTLQRNEKSRSLLLRPHQKQLEPCDAYLTPQRAPVGVYSEYYHRKCGDGSALLYLEGLRCPAETYSEESPGDSTLCQDELGESQRRQLERVFGSVTAFAAATRDLQADALRFQLDALRANLRDGGYLVSQLADTAGPPTGLTTRSLKAKTSVQNITRVHTPLRPLIYMQRKTLIPREEISVSIIMANDAKEEGRIDISLQVVGPTNQVLWKKKRGAKIPKDGQELWEGAIAASGSTGPHKFVVRLIQGLKVVAENSMEFLVIDAPVPAEVPVYIVDPREEYISRCKKLTRLDAKRALIHIVPPLSNTIRAYPEQEIAQTLGHVREGAVAIFFSPPQDWNDLANQLEGKPLATSRRVLALTGAAYHYVTLHPFFEGLPARGLMRQPYRNVVPDSAFTESTEEDFCGVFVRESEETWWGSNVLVRRYGSGQLVFTHLRILQHLGQDPLADRLFINMLNHFSRRSVPSEAPPAVARAADWLRVERQRVARRWIVAGDFPNWSKTPGHDVVFPPEQGVNADGEYLGWYRIIRWVPWCSLGGAQQALDVEAALCSEHPDRAREMPATAYAYAEFQGERRQEMQLLLGGSAALKCWINGTLVAASTHPVVEETERFEVPIFVKQGRNTVLIKCSTTGGPLVLDFELKAAGRDALALGWWK